MTKYCIDRETYDYMLEGKYESTYRASRVALECYIATKDVIAALYYGDLWEMLHALPLDYRSVVRAWHILHMNDPYPKMEEYVDVATQLCKEIMDAVYEVKDEK